MQCQRQRKTTRNASHKTRDMDRFTPLLTDIRIGLGDRWVYYEECIDNILETAARQEDTTAWFEQMQHIVKDIDSVHFSHQGVLFLLRDMGVRSTQPRRSGERDGHERKYSSRRPSLLLRSLPRATYISITNMGSFQGMQPPDLRSPPLLRSLQSNIVHNANPSARHTSMIGSQQQRQLRREQPHILREGVSPFDFNAPIQPGLTFPENFRAFHHPPEQTSTEKNCARTPSSPLKPGSSDPIFFSDPAVRGEIAELFGYTLKSKGGTVTGGGEGIVQKPSQRLPYNPQDDDLAVWKSVADTSTNTDEEKTSSTSNDAWPPWNARVDLEL